MPKTNTNRRKHPDPIDIHVGSQVRFHRLMQNMSQTTLGEHLGITFQQIQKYEKGTNRVSASRLQHIARVFRLPVSTFFENVPATLTNGDRKQLLDQVAAFLSSAEGVKLNKAFVQIKDRHLRSRIIDVVNSFAGEAD